MKNKNFKKSHTIGISSRTGKPLVMELATPENSPDLFSGGFRTFSRPAPSEPFREVKTINPLEWAGLSVKDKPDTGCTAETPATGEFTTKTIDALWIDLSTIGLDNWVDVLLKHGLKVDGPSKAARSYNRRKKRQQGRSRSKSK